MMKNWRKNIQALVKTEPMSLSVYFKLLQREKHWEKNMDI